MEVGGWVQVSLEKKKLENRSTILSNIPVLICWAGIPCVLCLCIGKSC